MTATLFELTTELEVLEALLSESGGELTPDIEAWMLAHQDALSEKVDGVGFYMKSCEAKAAGFEKVIGDLSAKMRAERNKIERLKEYVRLCLERMGTRKLAGEVWTLSIQKNGGKPALKILPPYDADPNQLPAEFQTHRVEADKQALRLAAEIGGATGIAELLPVGDSVRLR